jgi:hypothetical protein
MATRISVLKNLNGQITGWMCKHSGKTPGLAESNGHVILCERCASAVKNGAELLSDENGQPVEPLKTTVVAVVKRAAAAAAGR